MVNPLDLRGPEFLVFYCLLASGISVVAWLASRIGERGEPPRPLADYLAIAFLRGGAAEALRVAMLTMIDRGALSVADERTLVAATDAQRRVTNATERAILTSIAGAAAMTHVLRDPNVTAVVTAEYEPELVRRGLLPDDGQKASRNRLWLWSAGLLAFVAALKIAVAFSRGRSNVGFLVALTVFFVFVTFRITHPRLTTGGRELVSDLRTLFAGLKDRATSLRPRSGGTDLAFLVAVFGIGAALPIYPEAEKLFPQASASDGGSSSGSSCGSSSSSSSSSGSSCGSSCGGGGGGCGGCGS
jgi:uncharacterized protein (TIGR04222 family)